MSLIRHIHSSGRYDRPASALASALASYGDREANLITLTEQANAKHRLALQTFTGDYNYDVVQGIGYGADCAIVVKKSDFTVLRVWAEKATKYEQRRGPGGPPPAEYITALLEDRKTTKRVIVSVIHLPSHVEWDWTDKGAYSGFAWRVMVWRDAHRNWSKHLGQVKRSYKCTDLIMVADWNLNFKKRVFRVLLNTLHPTLKLGWYWKKLPTGGTEGTRLIDATLTNLKIKSHAQLLVDDESSDHRPYVELLEL